MLCEKEKSTMLPQAILPFTWQTSGLHTRRVTRAP